MSSLYSGIIPIIKKAAVDAVNSTQPVSILFGTVLSASPLKVQVTPKLILGAANLVVPDHLTKKVIELKVDSGNTGYTLEDSMRHRHTIASPLKVELDNSLKTGDSVILLRIQGGNSYLVLDKAVSK